MAGRLVDHSCCCCDWARGDWWLWSECSKQTKVITKRELLFCERSEHPHSSIFVLFSYQTLHFVVIHINMNVTGCIYRSHIFSSTPFHDDIHLCKSWYCIRLFKIIEGNQCWLYQNLWFLKGNRKMGISRILHPLLISFSKAWSSFFTSNIFCTLLVPLRFLF